MSLDKELMNVAGVMMQLQEDGGSPTKKRGAGQTRRLAGSRRSGAVVGAVLSTQPSFPRQDTTGASRAELKNNGAGGAVQSTFLYDETWQLHDVYALDSANRPLRFGRSPVKVARVDVNASTSSAAAGNRSVTLGEAKRASFLPASGLKAKKIGARFVTSAVVGNPALAQRPVVALLSDGAGGTPTVAQLEAEIAEIQRKLNEHKATLAKEQKELKERKESISAHAYKTAARAIRVAGGRAPPSTTKQEKSVQRKPLSTGVGASASQKRKRLASPRKSKGEKLKKRRLDVVFVTRITGGGKFTFKESQDFELDKEDDDKTIPPPRRKMAEWETKLNVGQWGRLKSITDCLRCLGHGGAVHKKDDQCEAVTQIRRYKLKKHFRDIEREKVRKFKLLNKVKSKQERRDQATLYKLTSKTSVSNMSIKQRQLASKRASKLNAV